MTIATIMLSAWAYGFSQMPTPQGRYSPSRPAAIVEATEEAINVASFMIKDIDCRIKLLKAANADRLIIVELEQNRNEFQALVQRLKASQSHGK